MVFGVLMAVYRFHLTEIARAEHNKLGFMRIRVAANNYEKIGFQTDVRASLVNGAFNYDSQPMVSPKRKVVESPLPGHPSSDISTMLINKMFEGLEVKRKE